MGYYGETPLHMAARIGRKVGIQLLLEIDVEISVVDSMYCIWNGGLATPREWCQY